MTNKSGCGCGGKPVEKKNPARVVVSDDAFADVAMPQNLPVMPTRRIATKQPIRDVARQQGRVWYLAGKDMPIPGA